MSDICLYFSRTSGHTFNSTLYREDFTSSGSIFDRCLIPCALFVLGTKRQGREILSPCAMGTMYRVREMWSKLKVCFGSSKV